MARRRRGLQAVDDPTALAPAGEPAPPKSEAPKRSRRPARRRRKAGTEVIFVSVEPDEKDRLERVVFALRGELEGGRVTQKEVVAALLEEGLDTSEQGLRKIAELIERRRQRAGLAP